MPSLLEEESNIIKIPVDRCPASLKAGYSPDEVMFLSYTMMCYKTSQRVLIVPATTTYIDRISQKVSKVRCTALEKGKCNYSKKPVICF